MDNDWSLNVQTLCEDCCRHTTKLTGCQTSSFSASSSDPGAEAFYILYNQNLQPDLTRSQAVGSGR